MSRKATAVHERPAVDPGVIASTLPEGEEIQRQEEELRDLNPNRRKRPAAREAVAPRHDPVGRYIAELRLAEIVESPMNPRKRFDQAGLEELTASIREKGILTPLLVRPVPAWAGMPPATGRVYEIASGHRRFRAARAAGLDAVPAVARDMTDVELLEVLVIENDQREDVHPLEEADGYRRLLMPGTGYDVPRVAARVGRSAKYVYDRLKLLELTKDAQRLFLDGKFTAGHAILLARLKPEDQKRALNVEGGHYGRLAGLFEEAGGLPFEDEAFDKAAKKDPYLALKPVSVREFESWIADSVRFDGAHVDPMLFPETARALELAGQGKQKVILITREYRAGDDVRQGGKDRVFGEQAWKRADGKEGSKTCERSRVGLVACGPGQGEAFLACIDKERCAVHWAAWQKERKKRQAAGAAGGGSRQKEQERWKREQEKREAEHAAQAAEAERWKKASPAILQAVAAAVQKAPTKATGLLGNLIVEECGENYRNVSAAVEKYVPRGKSAEDLVRHAAMMVLSKQLLLWQAPRDFPKVARAFGVDVRKILDQVAPVERACRFCGCTEAAACEGGCGWLGKPGTPLADVCTSCAGRLSKKERALVLKQDDPKPRKGGR